MACIFCQIIAKEKPARLVHEEEKVVAFHDLHPQAPTHLLIVPRRHIARLAEAQTGDEEELGALLRAAAQIAARAGLTSYRLVINTGAEAGQSVWHLHVHLLSGRPMGWPPG